MLEIVMGLALSLNIFGILFSCKGIIHDEKTIFFFRFILFLGHRISFLSDHILSLYFSIFIINCYHQKEIDQRK